MKVLMVNMELIDAADIAPLRKQAIQDNQLPVVGVIADDTGKSLWIGDEFMKIATEHFFGGVIQNRQFVFFVKK